MTAFEDILNGSGELLLKAFYRSAQGDTGTATRTRFAGRLGLTQGQLICALGFNSQLPDLPDVISILGYESYDALARKRDEFFTQDVYRELGMRDVLAIYLHVANDMRLLEIMQHLLVARITRIEERVEETVNSILIERYKKEMRAIYSSGIAQNDFVEFRLRQMDSGFRALLNETALIAEHRLVPIGDLFFRNTLLPEEKRRLIARGYVPRDLIEQRLDDPDVTPSERSMLLTQLENLPEE